MSLDYDDITQNLRAQQWRSYYGLKYSTNLPIILVFKVCLSKGQAHIIQADSMNTAPPLLY